VRSELVAAKVIVNPANANINRIVFILMTSRASH